MNQNDMLKNIRTQNNKIKQRSYTRNLDQGMVYNIM